MTPETAGGEAAVDGKPVAGETPVGLADKLKEKIVGVFKK